MKRNHLKNHTSYKKKRKKNRIIICLSIAGIFITLFVLIWIILMATGLFNPKEPIYTFDLTSMLTTPAESVTQEIVQEDADVLISVPYISQEGAYPTGCESVSAVMLLSYFGYNISVDDFIDQYLPRADINYDAGIGISKNPNEAFIGDPRADGYGCYAPVIVEAMNNIVGDQKIAIDTTGTSIEYLVKEYINNDTPVLLWTSVNLKPTYEGDSWLIEDTGELFTWIGNEHCMVMVGADDDYYYFNDPYESNGVVKYDKQLVTQRWQELGQQSVVVKSTSLQEKSYSISLCPSN